MSVDLEKFIEAGDDDGPPGKQRADYFSYCPNECRNCGNHKDENGKCDCKGEQ